MYLEGFHPSLEGRLIRNKELENKRHGVIKEKSTAKHQLLLYGALQFSSECTAEPCIIQP